MPCIHRDFHFIQMSVVSFFLFVVRHLRWERGLSFLPSCIPIWLHKFLVLVFLLWILVYMSAGLFVCFLLECDSIVG